MHMCTHAYVHSREPRVHSGKAPTTSLEVKEKVQDFFQCPCLQLQTLQSLLCKALSRSVEQHHTHLGSNYTFETTKAVNHTSLLSSQRE